MRFCLPLMERQVYENYKATRLTWFCLICVCLELGGLEVLAQIRKIDEEVPVVILTAYGDVQTAVAAMKLGAADYLLKGFDLEELLLVVQRALEKSAMSRELRQLRRERSAHYHFDYVVGHSERMREIFESGCTCCA